MKNINFVLYMLFTNAPSGEERGSTDGHFLLLLLLLSHLQSFVSLRYRMFLLGTENAVGGGGVGLWQCMPSCLSCEKGIHRCFSMK